MYDYLIVGAGLFGSIFAYEAHKRGKKVLVIEKREHIGGNIYTKKVENINVHYYGAHIFHTSDQEVWDYMRQFTEFNNFVNSPIANYKGEIYNLPFNMNTFSRMWNIITPTEAKKIIDEQIKKEYVEHPSNLREQAINLVGRDIYEKLIEGYTEKQWGRPCEELPPFIIKRLPVRFTYNNNYFNDRYQGIPIGGYTQIIEKMLEGIEVRVNENYLAKREYFDGLAKKVIYTGPIDEFYNYRFGPLEYRSLRFEHELLDIPNYQGNAVVNYTDRETPFTRIIEHKHFEGSESEKTFVTREYSSEWKVGDEPFYPINNEENQKKYLQYFELSKNNTRYLFYGRLAEYKYYDMHVIVRKALDVVKVELE